ncbi:Bcl-2 [Rhinolophus gammaherpesvirus 1]|uniref:Bcl-2 n=1 Tax=Rhinolophus gammaherpesvirus 1 TaxID=2054179 RepID=A0A2Z5U635_9GAMA|nr:Bcl-2 [Rhinolophus gammaherpesvirus 1]BBB06459.1 Bcl-2 [Rhinolophus gammaherpesvirus 1]
MDPPIISLVTDVMKVNLGELGFTWTGHGPPIPGSPEPLQIPLPVGCLLDAMHKCSGMYRERFGPLLDHANPQLGAYDMQLGLFSSELFRDGVNWGRIVAFFSFGSSMGINLAKQGINPGPMCRMLSETLERLAGPWIRDHDGWDGLVDWWLTRGDWSIWNLQCSIL